MERANKHLIIAVNLGHAGALKILSKLYEAGAIGKLIHTSFTPMNEYSNMSTYYY